MARRYVASQAADEEDVNVTPLLDVVFIMLIFFIVTSTFVKEPGIDPERPLAQTADQQRFGTILVAIDADDNIWLNREEVELAGIKPYVESTRRENPRATAVVQADVGAKSKTLIEVVNQIRDAGMDTIAISTEDA